MNNFNLVHNTLIELEYEIVKKQELEVENLIMYRKKHLTVVLKQLISPNDFFYVDRISSFIKSSSFDYGFNIHNTYLILTYEDEMLYEDFFTIERNNKVLRKYVIRNKNDLRRIPFLDVEIEKLNETESNEDSFEESNGHQLLDLIRQYNGSYVDLNNEHIEKIKKLLIEEVNSE